MLVRTEELAQHLHDPAWVIFDCRHDLMDHARGRRMYGDGHIPGAHFAAVETDLSAAKTGRNGRHPLPAPQEFAAFLGKHGVTSTTKIVAYDDSGGLYSMRLWWMVRWIGLERVDVLDGGFQKWVAEGRALDRMVPSATPGRLEAKSNPAMVWSTADVLAGIGGKGNVLVDARTPERFRGETEPIDPVAGRVPGAVNRPYKQNLNSDLTFRAPAELRAELSTLTMGRSPEDVGHMCGSGVTACANLFAMEYAGLKGSKLYAGSWSEWITDPSRPVARG